MHGYVGGEDFMVYCTRKWTSGILLRDYDSLCSDISCTIGKLWSGENPGPDVEAEKIMQVLCSGCERNPKSGTHCDTCGWWFHNSCGNVKARLAESRKWISDKCRSERRRLLEEKLQNALLQIGDLTRTRHWKNSYDWQQLEGKFAGGIQCRVILKVESV